MPTRSDYNVIAYGLRQRLNDAMKLLELAKDNDNVKKALQELEKLDDTLRNMEQQ